MTTFNTPDNPHLYDQVKAAFILQGTSLHHWCSENGYSRQNVVAALKGLWQGPKGKELKQTVIKASRLESVFHDYDLSQQVTSRELEPAAKIPDASIVQIQKILADYPFDIAWGIISDVSKLHFSDYLKTKRRSLSRIQRDAELQAFILNLPLDHLLQTEIREICIDKFGEKRAPSRNGLSREMPRLLQLWRLKHEQKHL